MKSKFSLYYNTFIHLKKKQIVSQLKNRLNKLYKKRLKITHSLSLYKRGEVLVLIPWIPKIESCKKESTFLFVNLESKFTGIWNNEKYGDLWGYNLNYMDYLNQPSMMPEKGKKWIMTFIDNLKDNRLGLSPYPIALRGINWIKFISKNKDSFNEQEKRIFDKSLYSQYNILYKSLEYHLLGNHLLEDAFSLLWGAFYFRDEKFYTQAATMLHGELTEEILNDGAHFEQSPMYHCILLDRLLDCYNMLINNIHFKEQQNLTDFVENKAIKMVEWLQSIAYRDNSLPFVNDTALNIAPTTDEIKRYAASLGICWNRSELKECGYRRITEQNYEATIDIGDIAAYYIPGHSHADTFSIEMKVKGKEFIVDTGISTYEKNQRREYERSTMAHNTVTIENKNSSKVWGGFRCAERAKIIHLKEKENKITVSHDGYRKNSIIHTRTFSWNTTGVTITDTLNKAAKATSRYHLASGVNAIINSNNVNTDLGIFKFKNFVHLRLEHCKVAKEYNKLQDSLCICIEFDKEMECTIEPNNLCETKK